MYLDFYELKKAPFHITPDPAFLFLSPSHKAALGSIIYGIEERQGFVAISGEVGLGKTTILRSYLERVDARQLRTIYIFNANVSFRGLLKAIFGEFGIAYETEDLFEMVNHLHQVLIEEYQQGRNVALIIDEAQNMPVETLENLRMLSNLETNTEKLVQIILIGQPEFDVKLNLNELRQLKQRLVIRSVIEPLTREESLAYVHHRLGKVAMTDTPIFTKGALKQIVGAAKGTPRALNILCTNTLIAGFGYRQRPITTKTVKQVINEFQGGKRSSLLKPVLVLAVVSIALTGLLGLSLYRDTLLDTVAQTGLFGGPEETVGDSHGRLSAYVASPRTTMQQTETLSMAATDTPSHAQDQPLNVPVDTPTQETVKPPTVVTTDLDAQVIPTALQAADTDSQDADDPFADSHRLQEPQTLLASSDLTVRFPVIRTIKQGEYISKLAVEIYGFTNGKLIALLKAYNPQIKDINHVEVGDRVLFPELQIARE